MTKRSLGEMAQNSIVMPDVDAYEFHPHTLLGKLPVEVGREGVGGIDLRKLIRDFKYSKASRIYSVKPFSPQTKDWSKYCHQC